MKPERWKPTATTHPAANTAVLLWCGWVESGVYMPRTRRKQAWRWYREPAGINPIVSATHWKYAPKGPKP